MILQNKKKTSLCFFLLLNVCVPLALCSQQSYVMDIKGAWRFAVDRDDAGIKEQWFKRTLPEKIQLPGTLQEQGFGDEISTETRWMSRLHDRFWYLRAEYKKYGQPGNIKIPFWLQPERHYVGTAWYQRQVTIPPEWQGRRVVLHLERAHWSTTVWLNDKEIGFNDSLSAPHIYELGILEPGKYTVTVRVENTMLQNIREDAHSITDSSQTNWNGLIGALKLTATTLVWIDDVRAFTDIERKSVKLKVKLGNVSGQSGEGTLSVGPIQVPVKWTTEGLATELEVNLGKDAEIWDEFNPALHRLTLRLKGQNADDEKELVAGLRDIKAKDAKFYLNGRRTFFRGTQEGCEFPLTGYPPTDVESWRKILQVCKDYGLNHMRFHSWCPPEAAFVAADEIGMYLQPECSNWGQYSSRDNQLVEWLNRETERIIRAYGNHPSFVLLSTGNEPAGPWKEPLLQWCKDWKQRDNRRLYASQTGRFFADKPGPVPHIDFLIAIRIGSYMFRGDKGWHGRDFAGSLDGTNYPVISHETGQWCAFPDFSRMSKYTGKLKPKNYEIFRQSLADHSMLEQGHDFMMASGKLQVECYKQEIEALLRTAGMGGFQLLDLHDYPGQGTALVGPLSVFWESKGYITPKEFRRFCDVTVPLARMHRVVYTSDETMNVDVEIAHFGKEPLKDARPVWKIADNDGSILAGGQFEKRTIPVENGTRLGTVSVKLNSFEAPKKYKLVVGLKDTAIENDWEFWLYPAKLDTKAASDIVLTRSMDEAIEALQKDKKVLFMPQYNQLHWQSPPIGRLPIFWNCLMGPKWERFLGLLCDPNHPALAKFPTDYYYDWQWGDVFRPYCRAINMDSLPQALQPIVQMIDDWNRNYKLAAVFQCRLGNGKMLVCAADLESDLSQRPAAGQLRRSFLDYMDSDKFNPAVDVTIEQLQGLMFDNQIMKKLGAVAKADEENGQNKASNAIDGNPNTFWLTARRGRGNRHPHQLLISFPRPVEMTGLLFMNRQNHREHEGDIREYVIEISNDEKEWSNVLEGQLQSTFQPQRVEFGKTISARYLKIRILSGFGDDTAASLAEVAVLHPGPVIMTETTSAVPYQKIATATEDIFEGVDILAASTNPIKVAPKPLYRDPVYDGAADPVLCWNRQEKKWFMFYTNRRANITDARGVSWVHGTPIGIAESSDGGATWKYRCNANIGYKKDQDTYWAPEVIENEGTYHMYLTYVPGIFTNWSHPRDIIHLTSRNLIDWDYQSTLRLSSDKVIDACVIKLPNGTWRMWYNNEKDGKSIYYADSNDLYTWRDRGKAAGQWRGEGPKAFEWKDSFWMLVDTWDGLGVYRSQDALVWTRQKENLLRVPGTGTEDQVKGHHPDVVVSDGRAFLFYFTHPGRKGENAGKDTYEQRRSSIQVVELEYKDGRFACDRNRPTHILLSPPGIESSID